jgi:alkanesulfonate monooxygenase SsuD/methylene tetrahydromethanopterin reductase-like flavin-dependent oxidoreductase (luciferase family)
MKIGVNLHNQGRFASKPATDAVALRAEALGYDSIWTADHILVPRTEPEPFGQPLETLTMLSYVAGKTDRIALGTSILVLPDHGALEGEPDVMTAAILSYRDAGVTHIVIDPDTNVLEQYLDDLERFAAAVRPLVTSPGAELGSALH